MASRVPPRTSMAAACTRAAPLRLLELGQSSPVRRASQAPPREARHKGVAAARSEAPAVSVTAAGQRQAVRAQLGAADVEEREEQPGRREARRLARPAPRPWESS